MKYKVGDMFILDSKCGTDRAVAIIIGKYCCKTTNKNWYILEHTYYNLYSSHTTEAHVGDNDVDIMINRDKFIYIQV